MKNIKRIYETIGSGEYEGIWEENDGRHFCYLCNKMLRVGQEVNEHHPGFRVRMNHYAYRHVNKSDCVRISK